MLRKCTDEDISDEECKNVIDPFYDNFDEYVVNYIMPEVIAFYIASSFYRNAMWEATFLQHFNSAADVFNLPDENYEKIKNEVIKKYHNWCKIYHAPDTEDSFNYFYNKYVA